MSNEDTQAAWHYHDGTKHPGGRLMDPYHHFDPSRQPLLFKRYRDLPALALPLDSAPLGVPALEAIAGRTSAAAGKAALSLPALARLLHFSAGITKHIHYPEPWGSMPFRAAACTGALYHIELYLVCGDLPATGPGQALAAGVYHFDPAGFETGETLSRGASAPEAVALRRLRPGDHRQDLIAASANEPGVAQAPATLVVTDVVWRNAVKYQAREYRHAFWDSGTMLANTLALAAAHRLAAQIVLGFVDAQVSRLLDLDPRRELALALVPLGAEPSAVPPAPPVTPLNLEIERYSRREVEFPAIGEMHAASSLPEAEAVAGWRSRPPRLARPEPAGPLTTLQPAEGDEIPADPIEAVIVRRGSARRFAREAISFRQLSTILERSMDGVKADFRPTPEASLNDPYLIVNAVEGLAPGAYVYHPDRQALELLRPGDFRDTAGILGLQQDLPADASVDIYWLADLPPILASLGNRGYRAAQLDASLAAGRVYLAAYALGLGASGLTFYDDAVTEFFRPQAAQRSPHARGKSVMFLMAVGKKGRRTGR